MNRRAAILLILLILLALGCLPGCQGVTAIRVREVIHVEDTPHGPESANIFVRENVGVSDNPQPDSGAGIVYSEIIGITDGALVRPAILIRLSEIIGVTDAAAVRPRQVQPTLPAPTSTPTPTGKPTPSPTPTGKPTPTPVPLTVQVIYPKEGAIWAVGSLQTITWSTTGGGIAYVGIYYSLDGGKSMYSISAIETNDGAYSWKIPNTPGKGVLVRVLAYNANGAVLALDDSGLFTISGQ